MIKSCNLLVTMCQEPSFPCADPLGFLMPFSRQPENHPHSGICKSLVFLAWMCWSRWHPLNFHFLGVHPRGDGNHLGQLHCRKWATSEKPRLNISTQHGVGLLRGQNARGRWEGGAEGAAAASTDLGSRIFVHALLQSVVTAPSCKAESHPSYFDQGEFSDQMN